MTDAANESSYLNSLPSDFADVQPKSYDPHFISQISNKMQVPDRIKAVNGMDDNASYNVYAPPHMAAVSMQVPDRISLDDRTQDRKTFDRLDFSNNRQSDMQYVGLMTPPRTLTMEEAFSEHYNTDIDEPLPEHSRHQVLSNGDMNMPVPFTPGHSLSDSLLHNDDDDATQIRTQVAKLSRRVAAMEQENQRRSTREMVLYPIISVYLMFRFFSWMFRTRN